MNQSEPIIEEQPEVEQAPRSSPRRIAVIVSLIFHLAVAIVLLFWYLPKRNAATAKTAQESSSTAAKDQKGGSKPPPPAPVADVPPAQIEQAVESQIEQVKKLPDDRKLSELEKNLQRLESVASQESVQEVSSKIASTLGLDQEQYSPQKIPAAGPFDTSTGQLQDVTRTRDAKGGWKYESVLVDADGRTMTVPLSAAEGETLHNTFQQMKKFPMAEGIYRSIVMPLLQKMLEAEEVAQKAAREAQRIQPPDQAPPNP